MGVSFRGTPLGSLSRYIRHIYIFPESKVALPKGNGITSEELINMFWPNHHVAFPMESDPVATGPMRNRKICGVVVSGRPMRATIKTRVDEA